MGRAPCCGKVGLNKGPWTNDEDVLLVRYVEQHGEGNWRALPKAAGLQRCGKSCRLRWINYLRPDLKRGNITEDEEDLIIKLHSLLGNRWSLIAGRIPGRTDNEIKNYWNTHLSKKLVRKGIDHPAIGPNPLQCSGNGVRSEQKKAASSAEKKDIHKRKLEDFNSNQMSDLESVSQDTHPSLLGKDRLSIFGGNMPEKSLMQHSEQPLQNVELSDTDEEFFCRKSKIENFRRSLPSSPATISSSFMQLDYHSDSASHNETSSFSSLMRFSYDDLTPLAEFEPSSGMTSPDSMSSYYSQLGTVCNPTFELKHNSKQTSCVLHNQGGNESLNYDQRRDSTNDTFEIAQEDISREESTKNILPDLEFLDESEIDNLWEILGVSPITEYSNADTIETNDTYWADMLMEVDPIMWSMYYKDCTQTAHDGTEE